MGVLPQFWYTGVLYLGISYPTLLFIFPNFYIINLPTIIVIQFLDGVGDYALRKKSCFRIFKYAQVFKYAQYAILF